MHKREYVERPFVNSINPRVEQRHETFAKENRAGFGGGAIVESAVYSSSVLWSIYIVPAR